MIMKRLSVTAEKSGFNIGTEAASPVVGVMLMLSVTLILAALVSGFVGGLPDGGNKASNVAIKATYSQTEGLAFTHMGGDVIGTLDTVVIVRLSNSFGDAEHMSWKIDPCSIVNKRGELTKTVPWLTKTGSAGVVSFAAGDTAYVVPDKAKQNTGEYLQNGLKSDNKYSFDNKANLGKEFLLEFCDTSGTTFARTRVIIAP